MVLVRYRSTEQGHQTITRELIDRPLVLVDFIHQDFEAAVHELVDFLGIELLGDGCVIRHVGKQDGYEFTLSLNGTAGRQDLIGQKFWGVGLGLGVVDESCDAGLSEVVTASLAEFTLWQIAFPTCRTGYFQPTAALGTEAGVLLVLKAALRAFHPGASRMEDGWDWLGLLVLWSVLNSRKPR